MTDLAKYTVALEAQTAQYMQALDKANAKIESFATENRKATENVGHSFRGLRREINEVLALYGVMRVIRAFDRWIADAAKATDLTEQQKQAVDQVTSAWERLHVASQRFAKDLIESNAPAATSIVDKLALGVNKLADAYERIPKGTLLFPLTGMVGGTPKFTTGGGFGSDADELAAVRNMEDISVNIPLRKFPVFDPSGPVQNAGQKLSPILEQLNADLEAGQKVTEQMATDVEKQVAEWHEMQRLFATGGISAETLHRFSDSQLQEIDITEITKKFKEFKPTLTEADKEAKEFARDFTAAFESRGIQALLNGDLRGAVRGLAQDFAELVIKLVILKPLAEKIAKIIEDMRTSKGGSSAPDTTGWFGAFAGAFGGGLASGGPLKAGKWHLAGEFGPEPIWGGGSGAFAAGYGGGGGVTVNMVNRFDVGLESVDQRIEQAAGPISSAAANAVMTALRRPSIA